MPDREKVIQSLRRCIYDPDPGQTKKEYISCDECAYQRGCTHDLMRDALALLREQEPRVLTLEELKSIKTWNRNTPPYLWVEDITGRDNRWKYWRAIRESLNLPGTMGVQNYGTVWRVWNLQPTPEQTRDMPWGGENDAE